MDADAKKQVLRAFTYGLYAAGCRDASGVNLFTANWCTQVSFDPPLVAVSVEKDSRSIGMIRASGVLTLAPYLRGDRELAGLLGRASARMPEKMVQVEYLVAANGCPVPVAVLGYVECRIQSETDAGDSVVFIAEVVDAHLLREGEPLEMREAGFRHAG